MKNSILKTKDKIEDFLNQGRLRDVIVELRNLSNMASNWEINEDIERLEQSYKLMLNYATMGVDDPSRDALYNDIKRDLRFLLDRVLRHKFSQDESTLYYNNVRYAQLHPNETIKQLIEEYSRVVDKSSLYNLIITENASVNSQVDILKEKESLEQRIFNKIWVSFPLKSEEKELLQKILTSNDYSQHFQELIVSSILMGLLEFYDSNKMSLLLYAYENDRENVSVRAFIAILLTMHLHSSRIDDKKILNHIEAIRENSNWNSDIKTAYLEFVRTQDTERISRKMQNELIPEMVKLRPDIYNKLNDSSNALDISSLEENPEWEELLQNSGITDKIQELNKLQEDGSDVFMSTFSHLKSFPFFSEISNWFLPFTINHSLVIETLGSDLSVIGEIIVNAPYLCCSDKYSFMLSMGSIPQQQRQLMLSQFEQMGNMGVSLYSSTQPGQRKGIMNTYLKDLYRFFKLFRRKSEFIDPFQRQVNLVNLPILANDLNDVETLTLVGEFYFSRKFYREALDVFLLISEKIPPTAQIFQKIGYCYHQEGDLKNALLYYEQAELLNSESEWTLRRLALCYRSMNMPKKALEYYERIVEKTPNDLTIALNIGHCYLELGNYKEATKYYYKVEYLDEKTTRAWRPLAWSLLLSGELSQSKDYYNKIINDNPTFEDYINVGHLSFAQGDIASAIEFYKKSIDNNSSKIETLIKALNKDEKYLSIIGIDVSLLPFVVDAILYSIY